MKKLVSKYLLVHMIAFSLPASMSETVVGLGNLVYHFFEHGGSDYQWDFIGYINDHYSESHHHTSDHHEHQKLPFHTHHDGNVSSPSQVLTVAPDSHLPRPIQVVSNISEVPCNFNSTLLSTYLDNIWQPPRA